MKNTRKINGGKYTELTESEIEIGDYISILNAIDQTLQVPIQGGENGVEMKEVVVKYPLPMEGGIPLRVDAVDLPYLLVSNVFDPIPGTMPKASLIDTRRWNVKLISSDYVKVYQKYQRSFMKGFKKREKLPVDVLESSDRPKSIRDVMIDILKHGHGPKTPPPNSGTPPSGMPPGF